MTSSTLTLKLPKLSFGVVCLLMVICPILSLPYILSGCYNNDKRYYYLASLFIGICALLLFLPTADQYRHAIRFYALKGEPWSTYYFMSVANGQIDFTVNYLLYLVNAYNLPFGVVRSLLTAFCSFLFLLIYDFFCTKFNYTNKEKKYVFWLIFLVFPMSALCTGMRFAASICFILYVFCRWNIFDKKNLLDYLFLLLAIFTHTGSLIPLSVYVLSKFIRDKLPFLIYNIVLISALVISTSFYLVLEYLPLPEVLSDYVQKYTEGKFANSDYVAAGANLIGLTQIYLGLYGSLLSVVSIILFLYKYNKETKLVYLFIVLYLLTLHMFSLNGRIGIVITIYGTFMIIYNWRSQIKLLTIVLLCITIFLQLFTWRKIKYLNFEYFFTPVVFVLHGDYRQDWIEANVNEEGTIKDYW